MTNKVDGITLLQMIKDEEIKDNTLIEVSGGIHCHQPYVGFDEENGKDGELYWKNVNFSSIRVVTTNELLEYDFEIIEEIEKPKKIELDDNCFIDYDETGRHFINTNRKDRNIYIPKINWLIDKVDYLLKKEEK